MQSCYLPVISLLNIHRSNTVSCHIPVSYCYYCYYYYYYYYYCVIRQSLSKPGTGCHDGKLRIIEAATPRLKRKVQGCGGCL